MRGAHRRRRNRGGAATALITLLGLSGTGAVAFALTHQEHLSQPPLSVVDPHEAATPQQGDGERSTPTALVRRPVGVPLRAAPLRGAPAPPRRRAVALGEPVRRDLQSGSLAVKRPPQGMPSNRKSPAAPKGPPIAGSGPAKSALAGSTAAPVWLDIPALRVRSPLIQLGLTSAGTLEVPPPGPHYDEAGWYRYSAQPGSIGPAVIAGHVDSAAQGPSVFFRLGSLRARDVVLVTRADGSIAVFAVEQVLRFRKSQFPTKLVYGNTDRAALRLITCGGRFDRASGHYLDNIVVMASLVRMTGA